MSEMILTPVMTSDNTPSGQCSASSNFPNGYEPYKAFTQAIDTTSMWHATGPAPQWIQYKFDTSKCVNKIAVRNTTNAEPRSIKKFILQASNDGSTWTNLGECNVQNNSDLQYFDINNSNKYEYYRLNITEGYDNAYIGLNRIDLIYKDETLKPLVPVMTSDTTPEGECGADISYYPPYYAFNGSTFNLTVAGTFWSPGTPVVGNYIYYKLVKAKVVKKFKFKTANESGDVTKSITLIASNDGSNWNDIKTYSIIQHIYTSPNVLYEFDVNNSNSFLYYGIRFDDNLGYNLAGEIQFYGHVGEKHLHSAGNPEAIRDWFNASLYNKEEIDNLFIQNNQAGLIPYDLTIEGYEEEQYVKLVGQTSGKVYNLCLAALMGEDMIDYKTTEQNTGIKWIDGKDIYQITINLPSLANGQISEFTTLIDKLIYIEGIFDYINSNQDQCRYIPCEGEISRMFWVNNSTHRLEYYGTYNDRTRANSAYITIRYTKP